VLSILFARAISSAAALHGFANSVLCFGIAGEPGCAEDISVPPSLVTSKLGDSSGEEKERRYSAMKNSSFRAQNKNRTTWINHTVSFHLTS
jgi:hypothetical protein